MQVEFESNSLDFGPAVTLEAENQADAYQLGRITTNLDTLNAKYTHTIDENKPIKVRLPLSYYEPKCPERKD